MKPYNGYRSWNAWNVSLWLNNDEPLYRTMVDCVRTSKNKRRAAYKLQAMLDARTPDGARYTITAIIGAMEGI